MIEKKLVASSGRIAYRVSGEIRPDRTWLIFLPGLTADRRLFEKQIECFDGKANVLVWDAPAHGFKMIAEAVEMDRPYEIDCPTLIICGTRDGAGFIKKYNREWEKRTGRKVHWIEGAGHNANCDAPEIVNALIGQFVEGISSSEALRYMETETPRMDGE